MAWEEARRDGWMTLGSYDQAKETFIEAVLDAKHVGSRAKPEPMEHELHVAAKIMRSGPANACVTMHAPGQIQL